MNQTQTGQRIHVIPMGDYIELYDTFRQQSTSVPVDELPALIEALKDANSRKQMRQLERDS